MLKIYIGKRVNMFQFIHVNLAQIKLPAVQEKENGIKV
jgi:hypothetical protein